MSMRPYSYRQHNGADDVTDEALILAIRNNAPNSRAAASQLAGRYYPKMQKYAMLLARGDEALADDILHNTFIAADIKLQTFKVGEYTYQAWIKKIAQNIALNLMRNEGRKAAISLPQEAFDDSDDPEIPLFTLRSPEVGADDLAIRKDLVNRILDAAERLLDDTEKQYLTMHYGEDKSTIEIAGELGVPHGTVRSTISRARATLRDSAEVQKMMGRVANPYDAAERQFDDVLHAVFSRFVRVPNPPIDLTLPSIAKFEILLAEVRNLFKAPIDRGFAVGWLKHLVYGNPAPETAAIPPNQQNNIVTNLESRVRAMYGS